VADEEPLDPLNRLAESGPEEDPQGGVRFMVGLVPPEELARMRESWERMSRFIARAHESVERMHPALRRSYQTKLRRIAQDLEALLGLGQLDDDQRANLLAIFLQYEDDDDGDDEAEPQGAPSGETVGA
jgi:hypothetical protein